MAAHAGAEDCFVVWTARYNIQKYHQAAFCRCYPDIAARRVARLMGSHNAITARQTPTKTKYSFVERL